MDEREQIVLWKQGKSLHNEETKSCCPDFSCCNPDLQATDSVREAYFKAYLEKDHVLIHHMLVHFLQAACNDIAANDVDGIEVHVVDNTQHSMPH